MTDIFYQVFGKKQFKTLKRKLSIRGFVNNRKTSIPFYFSVEERKLWRYNEMRDLV